MKNNHQINISKEIKKKLRHLRKDRLYEYSIFGSIVDKNPITLKKALSRFAKEELIIKVGSGKFYKKGERFDELAEKPLRIKSRKISWLKRGSVPSSYLKLALSSNLFWSNPKGSIPIDNIIISIIENNALSDLDFARFSFGDNRVIEVFLRNFNIHKYPMIRDILYV